MTRRTFSLPWSFDLFRLKEEGTVTDEIAGSGRLLVDWETKTGKPAIWLRKPYWGCGYSGERASALIELAFERLDLELIAVPVQAENEKSRQTVEKYITAHGRQHDGIIRNSTVQLNGEIIDHHRYTVIQKQYQNNTTRRAEALEAIGDPYGWFSRQG